MGLQTRERANGDGSKRIDSKDATDWCIEPGDENGARAVKNLQGENAVLEKKTATRTRTRTIISSWVKNWATRGGP